YRKSVPADVTAQVRRSTPVPSPEPLKEDIMNQSARFHTRGVLAVAGSLLAVAFLLSPLAAHAEWPERPVTMIVPWGAGGGTDQVARALAASMEQQIGQPVNVVNRTGG